MKYVLGQDGKPLTLADKMKMLGIDHDESKNENRSESTQILSMKQNATGDGGMENTTQYRYIPSIEGQDFYGIYYSQYYCLYYSPSVESIAR